MEAAEQIRELTKLLEEANYQYTFWMTPNGRL